MKENKNQSGNIIEKWLKDFAGDKPPARLLRTSDPKLRERAGLIYRGLGFILCAIVVYLWIFDYFQENVTSVLLWLGVYLSYLLCLELIRFQKRGTFDTSAFRALRIAINIVAITWLISISSNARAIIGLFYTVPIFAAVLYFPGKIKTVALTIFASIVLLYIGGVQLGGNSPLSPIQFVAIAATLLGGSYMLQWFQTNIMFGTDLISQISAQLHEILDIENLSEYVVKTIKKLARADGSLLIIVNPVHKQYVKHAEEGFELKDGYSIEDVAQNCFVINSGEPFDCSDMKAYYNRKDIYSRFFKCNPQSVFATPLYSRDHNVIGVLNIASDKPNWFDEATKDLVSGLSYLVSSAVENGLIYRHAKLTEIKGRELTKKFSKARDEQEIYNLILHEVRKIIPAANCVIHRLENKKTKKLDKIVLEPFVWDASKYNELINSPLSFRYGRGLAGHALKLREPILSNDVRKDPRYIKNKMDADIKSLLVCPLYNPNGDENYGVINLFFDTPGAFAPEDEISLTSLAHQASLALSKMGEFETWQEQGGILRQILNEVRLFDFGASDDVFYNQIAEAATKLLGFELARVRLLDPKTDELVTVAISAPQDYPIKDLIGHRMPQSVLEPFISNSSQYENGRSYIIPQGDLRWKEVADKYFFIPQKTGRRKSNTWKPYDAILTPLINASGAGIGLLTLDLPKDGMYPSRQLMEPIGLFAGVAAWAIQLSQYQSRLVDQKGRAKSFIETISEELAQGHDFQTIGEVVVQVGAKFLNAEGCNLYIVKERELELTHSSYLANTDYIGRRKPVCSRPKCGLTGWVAEKGDVLLYNNEEYKNSPAWAGEKNHLKHIRSRVCKSILLAPVIDKNNKVTGVISLENKRQANGLGDFDDQDKERLINIAGQLAHALERIGRYEAIKKWESKGLEDDLHFLINWYRFGVLANIEQLEDALYNNDLPKAKKLFPVLIRNARNSVNELKALHTLVINECLEADTLREGIIRLIDAWRKRVIPLYSEDLPMEINLNCPADLDIEPALRNTIIRITSEALSNSIFHSGITENPKYHIDINVIPGNNKITLKVVDNGVGAKNLREGVGIDRMKQLAGQVNSWGGIVAKLAMRTGPHRGTSVTFSARFKKQ
jgi:GAF domain-containing protein